MKAFLSIKFWGDNRNKEDIEKIISAVESAGLEVYCFVRDAEKWGEKHIESQEMMRLTFMRIEESNFLLANVIDWPIGVGVEVGYAYAKGIPVICICPEGKKIPNTVAGLAEQVVSYKDYSDLYKKILPLLSSPQCGRGLR